MAYYYTFSFHSYVELLRRSTSPLFYDGQLTKVVQSDEATFHGLFQVPNGRLLLKGGTVSVLQRVGKKVSALDLVHSTALNQLQNPFGKVSQSGCVS